MVVGLVSSNAVDFFAVFVTALSNDRGFFAVIVFFAIDESDGKDLVALVVTAAVLFNGDELTAICFCKLFLVLQIFGGGGAFVVPANCGLSFLRHCDCQRGVGGAVVTVTVVPFFFGGIAWMLLLGEVIVRGGLLGEWGDSGDY